MRRLEQNSDDKVAILTSLYRAQAHLPAYAAALRAFAQKVYASGIAVHYLAVLNDATAQERTTIEQLAAHIHQHKLGQMTPLYVPRESLYASWNRALAQSNARYFAPWNVDDTRSATAFVAGLRALQQGADLVDFPFIHLHRHSGWQRWRPQRKLAMPCRYHAQRIRRSNGLGPFFLATTALYRRAGPFDEHFRIAGDTEWAARVQPQARFVALPQNGGHFIVHGGNLSNTGNEREDIELNIIFMRLGDWGQLQPVNPCAMQQAWQRWGKLAGQRLPPDIADYLWGADAEARWRRFERERRQNPGLRRLRLSLAARGWRYSEEWAQTQRRREYP